MSKDTFYFSHDYNARTDDKIKSLIRKHGMEGYGIFWSIIEDLYNNANALRLDCDGIAFDLHTTNDIIKSIINDFGLFEIKDNYFGSLSVEKRLDDRNKKSETARQSAFKRWSNANALRLQCKGNAIKERKGKERKGKERGKKRTLTPPLEEDVIAYFIQNGYRKEVAVKAFHYYNDADWFDSKGNKVINWKQKMQSVWFKDEHLIKPKEVKVEYGVPGFDPKTVI